MHVCMYVMKAGAVIRSNTVCLSDLGTLEKTGWLTDDFRIMIEER